MILFLDFDGVLHPENGLADKPVFTRNTYLWTVLRACPEVEVVFSTSWRTKYSHSDLTQLVVCGGGEDLASRFVGCNPILISTGQDRRGSREVECLAWLEQNEAQFPVHRRPPPWVAVDDTYQLFSEPCWNLYLTDYRTGLTESNAHELIIKLKRQKA